MFVVLCMRTYTCTMYCLYVKNQLIRWCTATDPVGTSQSCRQSLAQVRIATGFPKIDAENRLKRPSTESEVK